MTDQEKIDSLIRSLQRIASYPANANSDPDVMARALDQIQRWAIAAIKVARL